MDQKLLNVVASTFKISTELINENSGPDQIERWDSLGHLRLMLKLEEEYGVHFTAQEIERLKTFSAIEKKLKEKRGA